MGHYASEMCPERAERAASEAYKEFLRLEDKIKKDVEKRGLYAVLADIVQDRKMYKLRLFY